MILDCNSVVWRFNRVINLSIDFANSYIYRAISLLLVLTFVSFIGIFALLLLLF